MCLETDSGWDNDRGITLLQQTASFMFNFHLIPEEGRGSGDDSPSPSSFRETFADPSNVKAWKYPYLLLP